MMMVEEVESQDQFRKTLLFERHLLQNFPRDEVLAFAPLLVQICRFVFWTRCFQPNRTASAGVARAATTTDTINWKEFRVEKTPPTCAPVEHVASDYRFLTSQADLINSTRRGDSTARRWR